MVGESWKVTVSGICNQHQPDLEMRLSFPKNNSNKENSASNKSLFSKNNELVHVDSITKKLLNNEEYCFNESKKPTVPFSATSMKKKMLARGI